MDRKTEIRELLKLSSQEVQRRAGEHLVDCPDLDSLHQRMAEDIAGEIETKSEVGGPASHDIRKPESRV